MVRIRLARLGAKKKPFYRIVAMDGRRPRDGRCLEQLGHYNPMNDPFDLKINLERVDYWIGVGAQPSDTVARLIQRARTAPSSDAPPADAPSSDAPPADAPADEAPAAAAEG